MSVNSVGSRPNIPNIDLSKVGSDIRAEVKKVLTEVGGAKDAFAPSSSANQAFASNVNVSVGGHNVSLPNPVGRLANKLLGTVSQESGKSEKALAKEFHLSNLTGGSTSVPPLNTRLAGLGGGSSTPAVGAGGGSVAPTTGSGSVSGSNTASVLTAGTAGSYTGSDGGISGAVGNLGAAMSTVQNTLAADVNSVASALQSGNSVAIYETEAAVTNLQTEMSSLNEMFTTLSQILQDEHQTKMQIIGNIK